MRRELHCWVFDNVRAKWPTVLRRPSRLPGLFSGYHAPTGLVHAVLRAVGIKLDDLAAETAALGVSEERGVQEMALTGNMHLLPGLHQTQGNGVGAHSCC